MALAPGEIAALAARWPHLTRSFEVYYGDQARDDVGDAHGPLAQRLLPLSPSTRFRTFVYSSVVRGATSR